MKGLAAKMDHARLVALDLRYSCAGCGRVPTSQPEVVRLQVMDDNVVREVTGFPFDLLLLDGLDAGVAELRLADAGSQIWPGGARDRPASAADSIYMLTAFW